MVTVAALVAAVLAAGMGFVGVAEMVGDRTPTAAAAAVAAAEGEEDDGVAACQAEGSKYAMIEWREKGLACCDLADDDDEGGKEEEEKGEVEEGPRDVDQLIEVILPKRRRRR